jgi:hypothetical protein
MKLHSIELTNVCNLKCSYCPNKGKVKYPKGFLQLNHFLKAMDVVEKDNIDDCIGLSVCGEPLLHPGASEFTKIARKYVSRVEMHTNGVILTADLLKELIDSGLTKLEISIHTKESYDRFTSAFDMNERMGKPLEIVGQVLSCNDAKVTKWIGNGKHYPLLVHATHNWNWDKPHKANRCRFIVGGMACMKWDGKIVVCCFDFNGDAVIGHIDNFATIEHEAEYRLCRTCSPSWATYQNDSWRWR